MLGDDEGGGTCTSLLWCHRALLVLSNLAFMLPAAECILRIRAARRALARAPILTSHAHSPASLSNALPKGPDTGRKGAIEQADESHDAYRLLSADGSHPQSPSVGNPGARETGTDALGMPLATGGIANAVILPGTEAPTLTPGDNGVTVKTGRGCAVCDAMTLLLLVEIALCLVLMLASSAYHFCMDDANCSRECLVDWRDLKSADFVLSFTIVSVVVFHTTETASYPRFMMCWKYVGVSIALGANIAYVSMATWEHSVELPYLGAALGFYALAWGVRAAVAWPQLADEARRTRWRYILLALASSISGFYVQHLTETGADDPDYWWQHSTWHVLQALAIWARFRASPTSDPLTRSSTLTKSSTGGCCQRGAARAETETTFTQTLIVNPT